ncbi:hypothetical protein IU500_24720 [Nocardia terpenica]|uniref:hypothetical protein n=1 Tax=Nocardia terpenica TaxID=455432 RepID=UPI001892EB95|nr:hypothetical protein [Nocardia terpenica]MBF6064706.1 hypothetical protein [Nocardia terpenica]MBF6107221.1 hypothetical protein [Nocardia terpenica]MBF6114979.1 hypothetical protein [Nocardia terpenica]MBF6122084.1 hypothetical protein [Nocardia terpenica]MBF6154468.1 hypothetical protein [Nocardia terpenica]
MTQAGRIVEQQFDFPRGFRAQFFTSIHEEGYEMYAVTTDNLADRVLHYRYVHELNCWVDDAERIVMHPVEVGALEVPATLGEPLCRRLQDLFPGCPIIGHNNQRMTILTRPEAHESGLDDVLLSLGAALVESTALVVLPSPATEASGYRWWASTPRDAFRPRLETVIRVADQISGRGCLVMRYGRGGGFR